MNNMIIYYLGDVGEVGLGGGVSGSGAKGAIGMFV